MSGRRWGRRRWGRAVVVWAAVAVLLVAAAPPASADPPGPTDYRTVISSVDPPVPGLRARIIGGDSFFELGVPRGKRVVVIGYAGERFLEVLPSGEVREDRASITYWTSRSRYGADVPDHVEDDGQPRWTTVAEDGRYAWHDHRAHWMNDFRPPGRAPGDQILEAVIPVEVDGEPVEIMVQSFWLPAPSPVPPVLGAVAGACLAGIVLWRRQRSGQGWVADGALLAAGIAAAAVGVVQVRSVPAETGPPFVAWLLPLTAIVAVAAAVVLERRDRRADDRQPVIDVRGPGLRALAGIELLVWVAQRSGVLTAAILPTDAPFWLDRSVTAAVAVVATVAAATALRSLVLQLRAPRRAPRPPRTSSPLPGT